MALAKAPKPLLLRRLLLSTQEPPPLAVPVVLSPSFLPVAPGAVLAPLCRLRLLPDIIAGWPIGAPGAKLLPAIRELRSAWLSIWHDWIA